MRPARACRRGTLVAALAGVLAVTPATRAVAAEPPGGTATGNPAVARELTDKGIAAQMAGQHVEALALFDAALAEIDHPKIRYFRAKSLHALGRRGEALTAFQALVGLAEIEKYRVEIEAFIRAIEGDAALDREREAREAAERARRAAEEARAEAERGLREAEEAAALKMLQSRRSGLLPPPESRLRLGPVSARMVPTEPSFQGPNLAQQRALDAGAVARQLDVFEAYGTSRLVAGILGGVALAGLGTGAACYFVAGGGLDGDADGQGYRTAGLTTGIIGVVAAVAALAIWPSDPPLGLASDPLDATRR